MSCSAKPAPGETARLFVSRYFAAEPDSLLNRIARDNALRKLSHHRIIPDEDLVIQADSQIWDTAAVFTFHVISPGSQILPNEARVLTVDLRPTDESWKVVDYRFGDSDE